MKKVLIKKESKFIEEIGYMLCVEFYNNGTEFYCLKDKCGRFNMVDTGYSYEDINQRIEKYKDMIKRGIIHSGIK